MEAALAPVQGSHAGVDDPGEGGLCGDIDLLSARGCPKEPVYGQTTCGIMVTGQELSGFGV